MNPGCFLTTLLLCVCGAGWASAQDSRIAVIDMKAVVAAHPASKALEADLVTRSGNAGSVYKAKRAELAQIAQEAQKIQENPLSKGLDGKLLPDVVEQLNALQKRGADLQRSILDLQADTQRGLQTARDEGLASIAEEVSAIVREVNGGRFSVVLDKSALSRDGLPQVVDWSGAEDITEAVLAKIPEAADSTAPGETTKDVEPGETAQPTKSAEPNE